MADQTAVQTKDQPQSAESKPKRKIWMWVLIGCGGCFLCILLTVGVIAGILGVTVYPAYKLARENVSSENLMCQVNTESDLRTAYEDFTTDDYQDSTSYTDFRSVYQDNEEFFDDCYAILPSKPKDFVGFSSSTTSEGTTLSFSKETDAGKTIHIELVVDEDGNVLLNDLTQEE